MDPSEHGDATRDPERDADRTAAHAGPGTGALHRFAALREGVVFAGRYVIGRRIGAGGSGEVFEAFDRLAEATVALKVLFPRGGDAGEALARLRRELRLVRSLDHPGIVRLHDMGDDGGVFFVVMDLLCGETLRERLARGPVNARDAVRILDGILGALAAAHARGVVHRDIKPANVFLARDEAEVRGVVHDAGGRGGDVPESRARADRVSSGRTARTDRGGDSRRAGDVDDDAARVVLLDFGLARSDEGDRLTETGAFLGTPEYVSPEQAVGRREIGPPTDVYSTGIVLWEMLAGAPPFLGDTAMETIQRHVTAPLPPVRSLHAAPRHVRQLVRWMLEKDPAARPPDAGAARRTLDRAAVPWRRRLPRVRTPNVAGWALGAAAVVALVFAAAVPAQWTLEGTLARGRSRLGLVTREIALPGKVLARVPVADSFPRRELLAFHLSGDDARRAYPLGLARFTPWNGTLAPFRLLPRETWDPGPPHSVPRFDRRMKTTALATAPWSAPRGGAERIAIFEHVAHFPSLAAAFDDEGRVNWVLRHPGALFREVEFLVDPRGSRTILHGVNNRLGWRDVLVGMSASRRTPAEDGTVWFDAPPYDLLTAASARPDFYVPLSSSLPGRMERTGHIVTLRLDDATLPFDLDSGAPANLADRDGLDAMTWRDRTIAVQDELARIAARRAEGAPADPLPLLAIGGNAGYPRASRGIALLRAAELLREAGRLDEAYAAARSARSLEPLIPGHARMMLDLAVRRGAWRTGLQDVEAAGRPGSEEFRRDVVLAALQGGALDDAREWMAPLDVSVYGPFTHGVVALQEGRIDRAVEALREDHGINPENAFLYAVALASSTPPACDEARKVLAFAQSGEGNGWALPFAPARALLARRCGGPAPSKDEIDLALAASRLAARENIADLYFLGFGERLAHGLPLSGAGPAAAPVALRAPRASRASR